MRFGLRLTGRVIEGGNIIYKLSGRKIFWVTLLNGLITAVQLVGGVISGSLALISDAVHNLSDTVAIALSYLAFKIAQKPKDAKRTYGYRRAEIIAAFINSAVLTGISVVLIFEAIRRFNSPVTINGNLMISVAAVGLVANLLSVYLLEKDSHHSINIKSSYLHLLGDALTSAGVVLGGIAIKLWGIIWVDPLITLLISVYILIEAWKVVRRTVSILLQTAAPLDYDLLKLEVEKISRVRNIHHVHTWMTDEKTIYFEAHIDLEDIMLSEVEAIYQEIEDLLISKFGVSHITLQPEVDRCTDK
ncbi:MAG: cation transporter, partial [Peptococcaceae bacterium]|nr:cation transporter [Peptococcaceae bacterium]